MIFSPDSIQLQTIESGKVSGHNDLKVNNGFILSAQKTVIKLDEEIEVIPMYEKDGQSNISDEILGQVFRRIVREEIVYKLFYDGSIRNTRDFRKFMRNQDNEVFFVNCKGREVGFFWLSNFRQKSFFINYCVYKEFLGETALKISNICINHIFKRTNSDGEFTIDVLMGLTPANNNLAVNFLLQNDMIILGKVPGFLYDSIADETVDGIFSYRQRDPKKDGFKLSSFFLM